MKKTKTLIAYIMLALITLALVFGAFGAGGKTAASAQPDIYDGEPYCIYYFFDYYPSTSYSDIIKEYPNIDESRIIYDRKNKNEDLYSMIMRGYFEDFGDNCLVIIDLKACDLEPSFVDMLFSGIKATSYDCTTMFITVAEQGTYDDYNIDRLVYTDFGKLETFMYNSLLDMLFRGWGDTEIFIWIDENTLIVRDEYNDALFMAILKDEIDYFEIIAYNATFKVGDSYWSGYPHTCAMGFWELNSYFRDELRRGQTELGAENLPVYLIECDPFTYSEDGLAVIFPECSDSASGIILDEISGWVY